MNFIHSDFHTFMNLLTQTITEFKVCWMQSNWACQWRLALSVKARPSVKARSVSEGSPVSEGSLCQWRLALRSQSLIAPEMEQVLYSSSHKSADSKVHRGESAAHIPAATNQLTAKCTVERALHTFQQPPISWQQSAPWREPCTHIISPTHHQLLREYYNNYI